MLIGSVSVAHLFSFLCYVFVPHLVKILSTSLEFIPSFKLWGSCCILCHILCLYVLGSMLWCPLRFPHENDVLFVKLLKPFSMVSTRLLLVSYISNSQHHNIELRMEKHMIEQHVGHQYT
jgi:hypothetical protein